MARSACLAMTAAALMMWPLAVAAEAGWPERLVGHGGPVKAVTLSDDGETALTASFDYSVLHWRLEGGEGQVLARLIGHKAPVNDVAFVPGARKAVSVGDDGALAIWDLERARLLALIEDSPVKVLDVAVSPDGRFAAAARWDGTARIFDIAGEREIARAEGHRGNVNAVAFSLDGGRLFTASQDGTIRAWRLADGVIAGAPRLVLDHGWGVNVLAPLPGASLIAYGTLNGVVGVVDLRTLDNVTLSSNEHPILSLAVSPRAGWLAAGSADGHIRIFDIETGNRVEDYNDIYGPVWGLSFTPDGRHLYRAGLDDFAIRWRIRPSEPVEPVRSVYPRRFQAHDAEDPGEIEFLRKCSVCHTLTPDDANRAGPTLYGLFGRVAGTVEGYEYSKALAKSDIIWTPETVSLLFDHGPDVVTPGTKMPIQRLKSVERRDALIEFLLEATAPDGIASPPGVRREDGE
ncbi:cytochrome C [Mesorhizobium xinjiangense]|uniref:cytochrome C n=1 Tax=Mesorhizobium xinjiangense TaxID=2678685 RepID=UPI001F3BBDD7|nr:cytochrome C [Mesorhizobium xinjiangense]